MRQVDFEINQMRTYTQSLKTQGEMRLSRRKWEVRMSVMGSSMIDQGQILFLTPLCLHIHISGMH